MFHIIALEEIRVPRAIKRQRDAEHVALRLTRKWESACAIIDDEGRLWGETMYVNWPKRDMPRCGSIVLARFECEGKRVI